LPIVSNPIETPRRAPGYTRQRAERELVRRVVYWQKADRLVYFDENATPEFWDSHWSSEGMPPPISPRDDVVAVTSKYLARSSRILEGGCGRANKVKAMVDAGFNAIGIDFAEQSVMQARLDYPGLDILKGDVRALDFPEQSFDGYWSIGVIEHFWAGYGPILSEAARVLRSGGFLFLTAPWFSPYRRYKARMSGYPHADFDREPDSFYQFALGRNEVCTALQQHGFQVLRWRGRASVVSMREDMTAFREPIKWLFGSRGHLLKRTFRWAVAGSLNPYCGHSFLAVARRR
jgi:SAM-dependent methyltransferase